MTHRLIALFVALALSNIMTSMAYADTPKIAIAVPLSGDEAIIGQKILNGAEKALSGKAEIMILDYPCEPNTENATQTFSETEYKAIIGVLCMAGFNAALNVLGPKNIPLITPSVRADGPFHRAHNKNWPAFSLAPDQRREANAVAELLTKAWREVPFAIVDDGTLYGRDLAETFRLEAETNGIKPVLVDTFRPQLENQNALVARIVRAGATHVFVGSDRTEIATIARDAATRGDNLTIAGGEALNTSDFNVPLTAGVLMVAPAESMEPGNYETLGAVSAEIALQLIDQPERNEFETQIGNIIFNQYGQRSNVPYALWLFDGAQFQPLEIE